ncbi:hypothetical protein LQ318_11650 [Aliifodinibius salicampi]|uniref:DoxX-like family protein n=1 Tax=Fodinibius salicampi TaxID=1920655 RepID=A0ABT3Q0F3_9BACT|nr:hypothetical protein [Fodinibius salicampi]MCW9713555.1 hypothetical protein [Fodinibius salicampi]
MLRILIPLITVIHGLIHLMGFLKAFQLAEIEQLNLPISKVSGIFWLVACLLMQATAGGYLLKIDGWWILGMIALVISQVLIFLYWPDAKFGTIANIIIGIAIWMNFR